MRYGSGGVTEPWRIDPTWRPPPSTEKSLSHGHQLSNWSNSPIRSQSWSGVSSKRNPRRQVITGGDKTPIRLTIELSHRSINGLDPTHRCHRRRWNHRPELASTTVSAAQRAADSAGLPAIIPTPVWIAPSPLSTVALTALTTVRCTDEELIPLAERFVETVRRLCDIELTVDRGNQASISIELVDRDTELEQLPRTVGTSPAGTDPANERYGLHVESAGARVWATHPEGVFRGLTSLVQLIATSSGEGVLAIPAVRLVDRPRFAWRGLSLDVARTFFGVEEVKSVIDLLSLYKFNALHVHLSDNEGWRLEIRSRPQLTEVGARGATGDRPGGFYTQDEFAGLVRYAADRFVAVVPELDLPGHAGAAIESYPELAPSEGVSIAGFDLPPSALNLGDEQTFDFVTDVLTETASLVRTPFLHIGGDEAFGVPDEQYERFVDRARSIVHGLGKKLIGWQEISRAGVGDGDVIQYWMAFGRPLSELFDKDGISGAMQIPNEVASMLVEMFSKGDQDIERAMAKKATVLLSPAGVVYLDTPYREPSTRVDQEEDRGRLGLSFYPARTIEQSFDWDPATVVPQLEEERDIAGVEAAIWCETVTNRHDLLFLLLPRLPGVAEKAWASGPGDWTRHAARLARHAAIWERAGWNYFQSSLVEWGND